MVATSVRPRCSALRDQDLRTRLPVGGRAREKGGVGAGAEASGGGERREATTAGTRSAHRQARSNAEALTRSGRRCRETEQADERVTQFENDGNAVEERKAETREGAREGEIEEERGGGGEEEEKPQQRRTSENKRHVRRRSSRHCSTLPLLSFFCCRLVSFASPSAASSSSPSPAHNGQEPRPQPERHLRRPGRQVGTTQPTDQQPARVRRVEARLLDQLGSPQLHVVRAAAATCACCNDAHDDDEEQEQQQEQEQEQEQERVSVHVCFDHA